jgi:energy-coupling factor transporter transmembrane protein EcfT
MKIRTLLLLLILAIVAVFTLLNWAAFMTPTALTLGVADVQAPLGLVMLGVVVVITAVFLLYVVYLQTTLLMDARQNNKELQQQRKLADQAEASRFTELRTYLELELLKQLNQDKESRDAVLERLDQVERELRLTIEQSGNSLAASIGQVEDHLDRGGKDMTHTLLA